MTRSGVAGQSFSTRGDKKTPAPEILRETDLFLPVATYLRQRGYTIRSEVEYCDIAAAKDDELVIVELKRRMDLKLILQAAQRQRSADSVYVAVPRPKGGIHGSHWRHICHLLRRLELGLILVSPWRKPALAVEVAFDPQPLTRRKSRRQRTRILREIGGRSREYNVGGSPSGERMTAYRENCLLVACCLIMRGPLSPRELRDLGTGTKTLTILSKNYYGWFKRIRRGVYDLEPKARAHVESFDDILGMHRSRLAAGPREDEGGRQGGGQGVSRTPSG